MYNNGVFTSAGGYIASDGTDSTGVMPYLFKISNPANLTVNGGVRVCLFYKAGQKAAVKAMPGVVDSCWYKMDGDQADVLSALTPVGLTGASTQSWREWPGWL